MDVIISCSSADAPLSLLLIIIIARMALLSQGSTCSGAQRQCRVYNNPFARRGSGRLQRASIEEYIKAWIEDIFYTSKKIDIQAKASIYRKLISDKFYELSSCSIVYSIIREKIKEICLRLRNFINLSYRALLGQNRLLSNLTASSSTALGGSVEGGRGEVVRGQSLIVAVGRGYVISYRYMCEVAKETFNFWKILYECTQVKDLRFNSLQSSLNEFILDTFVQPSEGFDPRLLLPNIAFPLKCKFIYAEPDGIKKREELTRFYDDQTVRRLLRRDDLRPSGQHELARARQELGRSQEGWSLAKKYEMFHRPRMDLKQLQHLRKCYLDPEAQSTQQELFASLFPPVPRDTTFSQEKLDLIRSLQQNHEQLFQIEDTSSQEDSPDPIFYDDAHFDRQDLLEEQHNIEMELAMNPQKHHTEEVSPSDGSTKSEPNDDTPEHADLPMRNYENEPPPPEFIIGEQPQEREKERAEVRRAIQLLSQYSHDRRESSSSSQGRRREEKMVKLKVNIAKSKQMRGKEKKVQFLDKRQLQEQKQKLEKYRRQLQRQKQQLLREVEKFMKQKKKESNLLALIKDKARYKFTRNYKCSGINHKIIHKLEKHQQKIESITLKYDLNCEDQLLCRSAQPYSYSSHNYKHQQQYTPSLYQEPLPDSLTLIMEDKEKMKEIQQAVAKDLLAGDGKLTKKQQKMKKKMEHESLQLEESPKLESKKSERTAVSEQEAALTNFLERLRIDDEGRAQCNIEEEQISYWKARAQNYRRSSKVPPRPPQPSQAKEQSACKQESGGKQGRGRRKKNRR